MSLFESLFQMKGSLWIKVALPVFLSLVLFVGAILGVHVPFIKARMLEQKKTALKDITMTIIKVMEIHYTMQQEHVISKKMAQQIVIRAINKIRYGKDTRSYFWINDLHPRMIVHPYRSDLNGKDLSEFKDVSGKKVFVNSVQQTAQTGEAFVSYHWQWNDRSSHVLPKLSYVRRFKPWGWIVGSGIYFDDIDEEVATQIRDLLLIVVTILTIIFILSMFSIRQSIIADRKLHSGSAFLEGLFNQARNCISVVSLDGRVVRVNKSALDIVAAKDSDVEGKYVWEIPWWSRLEEEQKALKAAIREAARGKLAFFESTYTLPDGREQIMDCSIKPLCDTKGKIVFLLGEGNDITERKKTQARLEQLNRELEERVAERTREIELSLDALRDAQAVLVESEKMAALGELVAGVAHEINTPLGIAVTTSTFLVERVEATREAYRSENMTRSDFEKFLQIAEEAAESMLLNLNRAATLVRSFKQVAVDQEVEEKRVFNVKEYLDEILMSMHSLFKHTTHSIQVECPDTLELDMYPGALAQIFSNLIKNSLVHGFEEMEEGRITIKVLPEQNQVRFEYCDNGRGMREEEQKRIFDPFFTTRRRDGGTGLGMHIVYNLVVRKLAGTIEVYTKPEEGVCIYFVVPR